jgi:hypothetical protein
MFEKPPYAITDDGKPYRGHLSSTPDNFPKRQYAASKRSQYTLSTLIPGNRE